MENYNVKEYTEVLELLKYIPLKDYYKIPIEELSYLREHKDYDYNFRYDVNDNTSIEKVSSKALVIFEKLYLKYIANEEQKIKFKELLKIKENIDEKEKQRLYDNPEIFKNTIPNDKSQENVSLIRTEKNNWVKKIVLKIKKLFNKNNL